MVQSNIHELVMQKQDTFDIDAWTNYFNLFFDKTPDISFEILDPELGLIDPVTGNLMALETGRTTVIARETGTENICIIPLRILENSKIEPVVKTNGSHTIMLKADGTVWSYGIGNYGELGLGDKEITDEPLQITFRRWRFYNSN